MFTRQKKNLFNGYILERPLLVDANKDLHKDPSPYFQVL